MQIEDRKDLSNHTLVIYGEKRLKADAYQIRMLQENRLEGFAACRIELVDEEVRYHYDVTSMQSLEAYSESRAIGEQLQRSLLDAFFRAFGELESYLLSQDGMVIRPSCIFVNSYQSRIYFCYYPENPEPVSEGMRKLGEFLLPRLDESEHSGVMLGFAFYQAVSAGELTRERIQELLHAQEPSGRSFRTGGGDGQGAGQHSGSRQTEQAGFDAGRLEEKTQEELERERILDAFFAEEEEETDTQPKERERAVWILLTILLAGGLSGVLLFTGFWESAVGAGVIVLAVSVLLWRKRDKIAGLHRDYKAVQRLKKEEKAGDPLLQAGLDWRTYEERAEDYLEEEKDTLSGKEQDVPAPVYGMEETTWLGTGPLGVGRFHAHLIRTDAENKTILVLQNDEHFLGKSSAAADLILPSSAASRLHAKIYRDGDACYLVDMRSKNGTFLNEEALEEGTAYPLKDGDRIRFADVNYLYREV